MMFVGLGGFVGSILRYKIGGLILHFLKQPKFPIGTIIINITGCLIIGLLSGIIEKHHVLSNEIRIFLFVGLLGGFTTFSAFGYETIYMVRRGDMLSAFFIIGLSVIGGLSLVWLGVKLGHYF